MTTPEKGDRVRVTFEGKYSHQGGNPDSTGFHIVEGASVPPEARFEVIEKALPQEPQPGTTLRWYDLIAVRGYSRWGDSLWQVTGESQTFTWQGLMLKFPQLKNATKLYADPLKDVPEVSSGRFMYFNAFTTNEPVKRSLKVTKPRNGESAIILGSAILSSATARELAKVILKSTGGL